MEKTLWMVGGDERSFWAAQHLRNQRFTVLTQGVPKLSDTLLPAAFSTLILPFPSFRGALVRGPSAVPVEELLCRSNGQTRVFGGQFGIWREAFESRGARVTDLYDTEPLTTANAIPTAEGAIALAMEHSPITLHNASCLVIGYGRIGKLLARRLQALGASVTVAARKPADRALAEACGLQSEMTGSYLHGLGQYDFVFNPVPAATLNEAQLRRLPPECVLLELASPPYGIDAEACKRLGISYLLASGLPGQYAPKTAGALYAQSILDLLEREETP